MKHYDTPELVVRSLSEDVITTSKEMSSYDDQGSWGNKWSGWTGGES